jgi:nucleobase:cation symporter-1, NCS1 family
LFTLKAIVTPIAGITFFVWCIVKAKGVGPIVHQPASVHGSELGWAMVSSLMSAISNMATLITNAPDFASRADTPKAALWPQFFSVPITFSIVSFLGIIVSSSSSAIYGEAIWDPIELLGRFLDNNPSSATRFGVSYHNLLLWLILLTGVFECTGLVYFVLVHYCTSEYLSGQHLVPLTYADLTQLG